MQKTERICLRAFEIEDFKILNKWRNDNDIFSLTSGNKFFISSEYDKKWVENKIYNNKENIYLGINLLKNNKLIGYLSINNIDHRNRTAEWGGLIIGEKELWNKGYGTEAALKMLDFVFNELNIKCFYAVWLESHKASLRMGEKVGFKKEGLLLNRVYKQGKYHNQISMSIQREDYYRLIEEGKKNG